MIESGSAHQLAYAVRCSRKQCGGITLKEKPRNELLYGDSKDESLLRRISEGDKAAMHMLFARHKGTVFRFVQRIVKNPAISEDVVSQVFLDVWKSESTFQHRARVSTWLLAIGRFKAITALRKPAYESIDEESVLAVPDPAGSPEVLLDSKIESEALRKCIASLQPTHRAVVDLFYFRHQSVAEMSDALGIPCSTVKTRLFYARRALAKELMNSGFGPEGPPVHRSANAQRI